MFHDLRDLVQIFHNYKNLSWFGSRRMFANSEGWLQEFQTYDLLLAQVRKMITPMFNFLMSHHWLSSPVVEYFSGGRLFPIDHTVWISIDLLLFQAGAVKALQESYNLDDCFLSGASAGALIAVLAGCKVDMDYALGVAERSKQGKDRSILPIIWISFGLSGLHPRTKYGKDHEDYLESGEI